MNTRLSLATFLERLQNDPTLITFDQTMQIISDVYDFHPTAFTNGNQHNNEGENEGSCKILAFGQLHQLTVKQTLHCFGDYYRQDVLNFPDEDSHQNIRQFMQHGWEQVAFEQTPLTIK